MVAFGRRVEFDERSRLFPIRTLVAGKVPRSYTWSVPIRLDQGNEGACVGFGWAHELAGRPVPQTGVTAQYAHDRIYWGAQQVDDEPGGAYPGAFPRYEGTSVLAGAKAVTSLGHMTGYRWAFGLEDLILAVGYAGPAVIGIDWYDGMMDPDPAGFLHVEGGIAGGHCTLVNKVSVSGKYLGIVNSWGASWGLNGTAKVGFGDMATLLAAQGEACIPTGRRLVPIQ